MAQDGSYEVCPICTDLRRKVTWVTCPRCDFSCCRGCTKKYLLEQPDVNPKCMSCKAQWDFEFVAVNTDSQFHNKDYREHRAKITVERERSLLPATQVYAERERKREQLPIEIKKIGEQIKQMTLEIERLKREKTRLQYRLRNEDENEEKSDKPTNTRFVGHCPQRECKGFLDSEYTCGLCKNKACRSCRLPKHEGDCDKDTVETVRLLAKDTKGCPNCGVPISKIDGCDQMWCVSCHVPFSWTTGRIERGRIHNPHYYQWQRQTGGVRREAGDVPCGGQINYNTFFRLISRLGLEQKVLEILEQSHRLVGDTRAVVLPRYQQTEMTEETNRDLRVKYLLGQITQEKWISAIKRREKQREKDRAVHMVLAMFTDTVDSLHRNIFSDKENVERYLVELEMLRKYTSDVLAGISRRFENKVPILTDRWTLN